MNGFEAIGMLVSLVALVVGNIYWHIYVIDKWFNERYGYQFPTVFELILVGLLYLFPIVTGMGLFSLLMGLPFFKWLTVFF